MMRHGPRRPDFNDEQRFPWIPIIAPLVTAGVLWVATGSPLSLLFGVMSPVMLVAQFLESRRTTRRRALRQTEHEARSHDEESARAEEQHRLLVEQAAGEHPPAHSLRSLIAVARLPRERHEFSTEIDSSFPSAISTHVIRVGTGTDGLPVCIDARAGIAFRGSPRSRRAVVRAATAQLWWVSGDVQRSLVAPDARWLVSVTSEHVAQVIDRDAPARPARVITPDRLSTAELAALGRDIVRRDKLHRDRLHRDRQHRNKLGGDTDDESIPPCTAPTSGFDVRVGTTREGEPFVLNLIEHGPHMAISGMTGSGKTSFLVQWLSTLVVQCDDTKVELAVIDFKGGIDFAPLAHLMHCVGFATDLEHGAIERALVGLDAEVASRERRLRSGARLEDLSRLIVVFDEFRATASAHPRAASLVIDLTARGRALGIHVVLSTQRASSSFSEEILSNVPLRVAFRSLTVHDSVYMVGNQSAYRDIIEPGDAVVSVACAHPTVVRMHPAASHVAVASTRVGGRRVWTDPLPATVTSDEIRQRPPFVDTADGSSYTREDPIREHGICIGLVDAPRRQRWESGWYHPREDGHMVITGTARTGRSTAIHALATQLATTPTPTVVIAHEMDLWDWFDARCRDGVANRFDAGSAAPVVLIDGVERMMTKLSPDARDVVGEWLVQALRSLDGARLVVSCDADGAWATRLAPLCAQRIDLRSSAQPGRATWRSHDMQMPFAAISPTVIANRASEAAGPEAAGPEAFTLEAAALLAAHPQTVVVIGRHLTGGDEERHSGSATVSSSLSASASAFATTEAWLARLGEFAALAVDAPILVRGQLSASDARILLRSRAPVPPMLPHQSILLLPDGSYHRLA